LRQSSVVLRRNCPTGRAGPVHAALADDVRAGRMRAAVKRDQGEADARARGGAMMRLEFLFGLLCLLLLRPAAARADGRFEVPIKQTVLTDKVTRYSIPVAVRGSRPVDVMLDTGSTGLRMLPGAFPNAAYAVSNQSSVYGYGSGVRLNGV